MHNFFSYRNFVGLGDWNLNKPVDCVGGKCAPGALRILIEKTFTKYDHQSLWINNIGIIKLATHVPFSSVCVFFFII